MNKKLFVGTILSIAIVLIAIFAMQLTRNQTKQSGIVLQSGQNPNSTNNAGVTQASGSPYQAKFPLYLEYDIGLPNGIILTDSQGRRSGEDPLSGTKYDEIPGVKYLHEPHSVQLIYSAPPPGIYTVNVIGAQTGKYALESYVFDGQHPPVPQKLSGSIKLQQRIMYQQHYDPTNLVSSTLVLSSTTAQ